MQNTLRCFIDSDVLPWERQSFETILNSLAGSISVETLEMDESFRGRLKKEKSGTVWIIAKDWRNTIKFLGVKNQSDLKVFVSVLELSSPRENIYRVLLNKFIGSIPESVTLLVHSPLNYRFFTELEGLPKEKVRFLPLVLPKLDLSKKEKRASFSVGVFGAFISDSHLNYVMSVAHYLAHKNAQIRFQILGKGPLYNHIFQMIQDLSLSKSVSVVETVDAELISELDALVYCPLRNDHFLPVYYAGLCSIPVIASEIPGVTDFIKDAHSGFVLPVNETKSAGELILRMHSDGALASALGQKLKETLLKNYSVSHLSSDYVGLFSPGEVRSKTAERAA